MDSSGDEWIDRLCEKRDGGLSIGYGHTTTRAIHRSAHQLVRPPQPQATQGWFQVES